MSFKNVNFYPSENLRSKFKTYNNIIRMIRKDIQYQTPLCIIAQIGDIDRFIVAVDGGADVNVPSNEKFPLEYALEHDRSTVVRYILENCKLDTTATTAGLICALKLDNLSAIDKLANKIIKSKEIDFFQYAVSLDAIKLLISNGQDITQSSVLIRAAEQNNKEKVQELLTVGCNVNFLEPKVCRTALSWAIWNCNTEIIDLLIENGAVREFKPFFNDPVILAFKETNEYKLKFAFNFMDKKLSDMVINQLIHRVTRRNCYLFGWLMDNGLKINKIKNEHNLTTHLITPILLNRKRFDLFKPDFIKDFISSGSVGSCYLNLAFENEYQPDDIFELVDYAIQHNTYALKSLINYIPDELKERRDNVGRTLAMLLAENGLYIDPKWGLNINAVDWVDRTPLHYACIANELRVVKNILELGANAHLIDILGYTAKDYLNASIYKITETQKAIELLEKNMEIPVVTSIKYTKKKF